MKSAKFKDSPLGLIPQDWEVKTIAEFGQVVTGSTPPRVDKDNWNGDFPWISAQDFRGKYICESKEHISGQGKKFCRLLPAESVLVTCIASIGLNAIVKIECATNQQINAVICEKGSPDFLYYTMEFNKARFLNLAGQTAVPIINKGQFETFTVPYPPLEEQRRIAETLGEVDKLIESLDEQIEKKRLIAKGVAHDLLSDAKRLPGFKGEWKSVRLGELSEIVTGGTPSTEVPAFWGGDIRWMNSGDVHLKRIHDVDGRITQLGYASSNARLIPIGSVVIALAGQGKTRGTAAITECELCTNQSIGAILPSEKHDSECLYYVLAMQYEKLRAASSGDGTRGGLSKKILEEYIVKLPVDIAEQQAIADLLGEQDAAIAVLEEKREKYARIKEGMMRDLLTGKVRMKGECDDK